MWAMSMSHKVQVGVTHNPTSIFLNPSMRDLLEKDIAHYVRPPKSIAYPSFTVSTTPTSPNGLVGESTWDYETTGLKWKSDRILCLGIRDGKRTTIIAPLKALPKYPHDKRVWAHNAIFEWCWTMEKFGQDIPFCDTKIPMGLEYEDYPTLALKHWALYWGYGDYGLDRTKMESHLSNDIYKYCAMDCLVEHSITTRKEFKKWIGTPIEVMEQKLIRVLARMTWNGIRMDRCALQELQDDSLRQASHLTSQLLKDSRGHITNLRSNPQISHFVYKVLGLKHKESPSVTADVLLELQKNPFCQKLLKYRKLMDMVSKFTVPLLGLKSKEAKGYSQPSYLDEDDYIHSSPMIHGTNSGRLTQINPNVQQWPPPVEACIISRFKDGKIIRADWKTVEVVWAAFLNGDLNMRRALRAGRDIHVATAALIFDVPERRVTNEQRQIAKTCNFLLIYLGSEYRLADELHVSVAEATDLRERWLDNYPRVEAWASEIIHEVKTRYELWSLMGRRRRFPDMSLYESIGGWQGSQGRHIIKQAVNFPVQSVAADTNYLALIVMNNWILREKKKCLIIQATHDEIVFDCPFNEIEWLKKKLDKVPNSCYTILNKVFGIKMDLPLRLEIK